VNAPKRYLVSRHELPGIVHRPGLLPLATLLPLAIDTDIERHRVVDGCRRARHGRDGEQRARGQDSPSPHHVRLTSPFWKSNHRTRRKCGLNQSDTREFGNLS
jgi:hypothetical protein